MRHGRGAAAAFERNVAETVLRHQANIGADLAQAAAYKAEPVCQLDNTIALSMPAPRRHAQLERLANSRRDRIGLLAKFVERAGGTPELQLH